MRAQKAAKSSGPRQKAPGNSSTIEAPACTSAGTPASVASRSGVPSAAEHETRHDAHREGLRIAAARGDRGAQAGDDAAPASPGSVPSGSSRRPLPPCARCCGHSAPVPARSGSRPAAPAAGRSRSSRSSRCCRERRPAPRHHSSRQTRTCSSRRVKRPSQGMPQASYSSFCQPTPRPMLTRPRDMTSSVASCLARSTAGRSGAITTPVDRRMRCVTPASAASTVRARTRENPAAPGRVRRDSSGRSPPSPRDR